MGKTHSAAATPSPTLRLLRRLMAFRGRSGIGVSLIGTVSVAAVGVLDALTGPEVALSILYLLPIGGVAALASPNLSRLMGLFAALTWLAAGRVAGAEYSTSWVAYWNTFVRLGIFLMMASLVQALREALDHERQVSATCPLTGLLNSRSFLERTEEEIHRRNRTHAPLSLVYIDLDDFKQINDSCGHAAGDDLLRDVASELRAAVRRSDVVARLGGDEFALLLPEAGPREASIAASHVLERVREAADIVNVGASAGVVTLLAPASADDLLAEADRLMYAAKRDGKGAMASGLLTGPGSREVTSGAADQSGGRS